MNPLIERLAEIHEALCKLHWKQGMTLLIDNDIKDDYTTHGIQIVALERESSEILWHLAGLKSVVPSPEKDENSN